VPDNATMIGNTTSEVELKFLNSGQAVALVSVAVNRRWKKQGSDEWQEKTSYFDVVMYGKLAENAQASCPKGTRVVATGRFEQRSWETDDGNKRSKIEFIADDFAPSLNFATVVVTRNPRNNDQRGGSRPSQRQQPPDDEYQW
jgi:single-strand DNA-binding protein